MDDPRMNDQGNDVLILAAKWLWMNAPHGMQRTALEHVTDNPEVADAAMAVLIRARWERQAERN